MPRAVSLVVGFVVAAVGLAGQAGPPAAGTGLVAGRVVDGAGATVPDAVVFLRTAATMPGPMRPSGPGRPVPVRTDADGRFVFTAVPAGNYTVQASKAGWLPGAFGKRRPTAEGEPLELADGQHRNDLAITLWQPGVIGGTVTDDNGDPLVGVEVRAIRQTFVAGRRQSAEPIRQRTDDQGTYRFPNLVPGDYLIAMLSSVVSEPPAFAGAIRAGGETPRAYLQTMTAIGTAPIVFSRATGVTGSDRPLVGALSHLPGMPDADGVWATYPTTYHPNALTQSTAPLVRARSGEARESVDIHVQLVPTFQVSGVLHDADGPAPWHAVHLVAADTGETPLVDASTAVTDSAGAFTFYGVPPGAYIARVIRTPYPTGPGQRLSLAGGTGAIPYVATVAGGPSSGPPPVPDEPLMHVSEPVSVSDRHVRGLVLVMSAGPRVRGRAVFEGDAAGPTPEQWGQIQVHPFPANGRQDRAIWPGRFTPDRQFSTPGLWPGRYVLRATAPPGWHFKHATYQGRDVSDAPFDLTADIDTVVITFTDSAPRLTGTVQGDTGQAADDAMVVVFPMESSAWVDYGLASRRVTSAGVTAAGTFSMQAPPDGDYYIVAIPVDRADDWQDPARLKVLATLAERMSLRGDAPPAQTLRVRRTP
jgi:protocatechuate 3,4-dioxygenase beta subunit